MADHRKTVLTPGLLLAALALWGCPGSPSHMSTLPSEAPPPPPPSTPTARVTHNSGLIIEAGSTYDLTRELELIEADWELAEGGMAGDMMAFLGSRDSRYISSQVSDIHAQILPRLIRKIEQSPLRYERWNRAYRLWFNVSTLYFWFDDPPRSDWPRPVCWTEIRVSLYETEGDSLLFWKDPNLTVEVKKKTRAGRSTLEQVYEEAAQGIFDAFNTYWSSRPR